MALTVRYCGGDGEVSINIILVTLVAANIMASRK